LFVISAFLPLADATLSIDVIYQPGEDAVFEAMIRSLSSLAACFVLIYASNADLYWPVPHVRHRACKEHLAATQPNWWLVRTSRQSVLVGPGPPG
jgi:hypothetical protein